MINKILLVILIIVHIFILTKLIYFPYPELFVYPYLTNHGLKPYSQILDQHFPGLMFLPINLDNLGMNNEVIARIWSMGIIILTHILLFIISSRVLKSKQKALLVNFLYLIWQPFFEGWVLWIDSFLPLILLPAFYFLYQRKLFVCGLLVGIGIVFKQTLIPLALLTFFYIFWTDRERIKSFIFLLGILIPLLLMILYLTYIGVLKDFWYWTIIFNLTTYAKYGTSIPLGIGYMTRILVVYSPAAFLWFSKDKQSLRSNDLRRLSQTLFIFLLGSLVGVFDRANFVHLQPSLPFALLATVIGIEWIKLQKNIWYILSFGYLFISTWWLIVFFKGHLSSKVFFFDEQTKQIASKIKQYTKKEDRVFVFGAASNLYQLSDRLPAGNLFVYQFPWFLKIAGNRILEGLKNDQPKIVVSDRTVKIEEQPITEFAKDIDRYIQDNYQVIDQVNSVSLMRRLGQ